MKEIEPVSAIMNERRVVLDPGLWPTSSENKFELSFDRFSHDDADAASECDGLTLQQKAAGQVQERKSNERDNGQRDKRIRNVVQPRKWFIMGNLRMGK